MTKFKASNIFDFYAPPSGGSKIADFGNSVKKLAANATAAQSTNGTVGSATKTSASASSNASSSVAAVAAASGNSPGNSPKKDNTLVWVVLGTVVFVGGLYLWHRHNKKQEEEEEKRKRK